MTRIPDRGTTAERGYGSKWQRYRARFLQQNPLCVLCWKRKRAVRATVVDHVVPHKGDPGLFWDPENHQALCSSCHSGAKQSEERTGTVRGCDEGGLPLDAGHPWRTP